MPIKDMEVSSMVFMNGSTGEIYSTWNNIDTKSMAIEPPQFSTNEKIEFPISMSANFECDVNQFNLEALMPKSLTNKFTMTMDVPEEVQFRRHKCKRINKKWAKRYGYKTIYKTVSFDVDSINDNQDGTFSFEFKCPPKKAKELMKNAIYK